MTIPKDKILVSLVISNDQLTKLKLISKREDCSVSSLIRKGIKFILNKYSSPLTNDTDFSTSNEEYLFSVLEAISTLDDE